MTKSNEELNARNMEMKHENPKLIELNEKELEQVSGGTLKRIDFNPPSYVDCPNCLNHFKTNHSPTTCGNCGTVFYVIIS